MKLPAKEAGLDSAPEQGRRLPAPANPDHVRQSGYQSLEGHRTMKKFGVILYSLLCILLLGACKEDEYVYPNVITTFIDAATDESGTLQKLITDKGESLQILNREGLDGLTPDSIYRSVSIYELKESADEGQATALLYSCQLIIAVKPVTSGQTAGSDRQD
mgnify:FL=1